MQLLPKNFHVRNLRPSEQDIDSWFEHLKAGETFNNAIANARISSYFNEAIAELGFESDLHAFGIGHNYNYIVPGWVPVEEADRIVYGQILAEEESEAKEESQALKLLTLVSLAILNKSETVQQNREESDNDERQQQEHPLS